MKYILVLWFWTFSPIKPIDWCVHELRGGRAVSQGFIPPSLDPMPVYPSTNTIAEMSRKYSCYIVSVTSQSVVADIFILPECTP